jgi:RNA polymerase II-associated factor 1
VITIIQSNESQKKVGTDFLALVHWLIILSKLDLLVRVRYSNPLPAPPCPPKLLEIPTNPLRYARPQFLDAIANDTPLPMIVDAECGMPLDLGRWECLWEDDGDDACA